MKLVIDIPEDYYNAIKKLSDFRCTTDMLIIKYGTPLSKGHGDLIDINDLLEQIGLEDTEENREDNVGEIITLEDIDRVDVIIPADKEVEE